MTWQSKRFQKELKRQLKREFSMYNHKFRPNQSHVHSSDKQAILSARNDSEDRSESRTSHKSNSHRARSSNADVANLTPTRSNTSINASTVGPAVKSAPLLTNGALYKSTSDLYIEKFNNRLTALEAELKRDYKINKTMEDQKQNQRKLYRDPEFQIPYKTKDTRDAPKTNHISQSTQNAPGQKISHNALGQNSHNSSAQTQQLNESFLVKPVLQREPLKPIEKVTQKINSNYGTIENFSKTPGAQTQLKYTTLVSGDLNITPSGKHVRVPSGHSGKGHTNNNKPPTGKHYITMSGGDASHLPPSEVVLKAKLTKIPNENLEKTLHSYKVAIETTKQSLFQTLSASKIQRRGGATAKGGFSSPATLAVCENLANGNNTLEKQLKDHSDHLSEGDAQSAKRKPHIPGILPEIAGKRLEVPATYTRW